MGLFGVLASIITGGTFIVDSAKNASFNCERKQKSIQNGEITWTDYKGNDYLVSTGEQVFSHGGKLRSVKTGKVIIDYNKERERTINTEAIAKAKSEGKKYARLLFTDFNNRYYYVELSTMKRYYLQSSHVGTSSWYYKNYYPCGREKSSLFSFDPKEEKIQITKEEFVELGGTSRDVDQELGRIL